MIGTQVRQSYTILIPPPHLNTLWDQAPKNTRWEVTIQEEHKIYMLWPTSIDLYPRGTDMRSTMRKEEHTKISLSLPSPSHLISHIIPKTDLSSHIWEIFIMWVAMPKYYPSLVVDQATKWLWPKWLEPNNVLESMHETHHVARELEK